MFDDKNTDDVRPKEANSSPEVKLNLADRAVSYGLSRIIDRPRLGSGRRRIRRIGKDYDVPTGGIPGTREPTGSGLDPDRDGWSDEGTKKPTWVGLPKIELQNKPKINVNKDFYDNGYKFRLSSGSGSKKLQIISDDDERVKDLLSLIKGIPDKPKEEITLSSKYTDQLERGDELKRFLLNQRRFVEFTKPNGQKKLYMLQNTNDANTVYAYDVDKLKNTIKEKYPFNDFFARYLEEPYRYKIRSANAGTMHTGKPFGNAGKQPRTHWEIDGIEVKQSHRRRGLGSAMLKFHRDTFPEYRLDHSPMLSEDGKKFATAMPVERLSSGVVDKPKYPRKPTYGAFLDSADEIFGDAKTWEEFKEIYDDTEIVFLDYETTGIDFDEFRKALANGNPLQLALVKRKGDKVIDKLDLFMNPEKQLGGWSKTNLKNPDGNPLTDEWLSGQMTIAEAHKKAVEFIGDNAIIGVQNAAFDKDVLEDALSDSGIDWRPSGYIDTMAIADMVLPRWTPESQDGPFKIVDGNKVPSSSLAHITKYLGIDLGDKHHYALDDALAASEVMKRIIDGAIANEWSKDVLSRSKRIERIKNQRTKFENEVKAFEKAKVDFLKGNPPKSSTERLSSGGNNDQL